MAANIDSASNSHTNAKDPLHQTGQRMLTPNGVDPTPRSHAA